MIPMILTDSVTQKGAVAAAQGDGVVVEAQADFGDIFAFGEDGARLPKTGADSLKMPVPAEAIPADTMIASAVPDAEATVLVAKPPAGAVALLQNPEKSNEQTPQGRILPADLPDPALQAVARPLDTVTKTQKRAAIAPLNAAPPSGPRDQIAVYHGEGMTKTTGDVAEKAAVPVPPRWQTAVQSAVQARLPPALVNPVAGPVQGKPVIATDVQKPAAPSETKIQAAVQPPVTAAVAPVSAKFVHAAVGNPAITKAVDVPEKHHPAPRQPEPLIPAKQSVPAMAASPVQVAVKPGAAAALTEKAPMLADAAMPPIGVTQDRSVTQTTAITASVANQGAETARPAAAQIAVAVTQQPGKPTEIALNPEELGRVRLSMTAAEGAITLNIVAERPETHDLLRRHIDVLAQEFRNLGYDALSFSFGAEGQTDENADQENHTHQPDIADEVDMPVISHIRASATSALDLRL